MYTYPELLGIIGELRGEHGCPWDRAQTHESMIPCLRDECEEVIEAIGRGDDEDLCEELGDVLLQVVLNSQIAREENLFTIDDVIDGLCRKMIRRHPHVFGDAKAGSPEEGRALWDAVKAQEKAEKAARAKNIHKTS